MMLFSYNWLQSFFDKRLPNPKKLAQLLTLHSFEVQEIRKERKDWVFDIEVTPNRPDCFSHLGIAKECQAFLKSRARKPKAEIKDNKKAEIKKLVKIEVEDSNDCPRYTGRVILGVKVKPSPRWMQERLIACGVLPINNIVDATNYVMLEIGQPLHAFDLDKLSSQRSFPKKIIIRRAKKGEKIEALDGKSYSLDENILIIANESKPLAIAGIKGGKEAEIGPQTVNIFIESANFNPLVIRKGSKKLKLKTDASFRFEHGLDPNMTEIACRRVAKLIQEIAGGRIAKGRVDVYSQKVKSKKIILNLGKVEKVLGICLSKKRITEILKSLDLKILSQQKNKIVVEVPTRRQDLKFEEDLIEEIGRIYGYENILPKPPLSQIILPQKNFEILSTRLVKERLKEIGFVEVYNYSFISKKDGKIYGEGLVELENPISEEFQYLRPTLLINLIKNVKENLKYFGRFKIFELGRVFRQEKGKVLEKEMLSGVIAGEEKDQGFYVLKGYIDGLLQGLGITDYFYDSYQQTPEDTKIKIWHINKSAEIKVNRQEVGFLGEISAKALDFYGIKKPVFAFDIDFEKLRKFICEEKEYQEIPKYPAAVRDIAILVPIRTLVDQVQRVIFKAGGDLLRDVDLFDMYLGEEIPQGKKNLAFHLIFQSDKKTLSSKEVDKLFEKIIQAVEENPEWEVRR
jgi:phenylalanyl-tRNA synthetase beta chain